MCITTMHMTQVTSISHYLRHAHITHISLKLDFFLVQGHYYI